MRGRDQDRQVRRRPQALVEAVAPAETEPGHSPSMWAEEGDKSCLAALAEEVRIKDLDRQTRWTAVIWSRESISKEWSLKCVSQLLSWICTSANGWQSTRRTSWSTRTARTCFPTWDSPYPCPCTYRCNGSRRSGQLNDDREVESELMSQ